MEVHRFEKVWLLLSVLLIVGYISTVVYGAVGPGIQMVDDAGGQVDPGAPVDGDNFREPGVYETGDGEYAVYVEARQFQFAPGTSEPIRVPAGSTVTLYVTSPDVVHGFELVGTNVNTMVIPGQVTRVTVEFDEPARYGIVCNEYCGGGHHTMEGQLIVQRPGEFDDAAVQEADGTEGDT